MRLVRVLQLRNTFLGDSLTEEIVSLFHLRYLMIRTNVKTIPLSWVNLELCLLKWIMESYSTTTRNIGTVKIETCEH